MNILFTLLALKVDSDMYLNSAKKLTLEILSKTKYDILISTNNIVFFKDITDSRCIIRNNIDSTSILKYGSQFNYNLKYHAFKNISSNYDYIIYLDADIQLSHWTKESEQFMNETMIKYEYGADRLNAILGDEVGYFLNNKSCLFKHKINSYNILQRYALNDDIMKSRLPSEHFLIFKNSTDKLEKFALAWKNQNDYLQKTENPHAWGDGFEIGISARMAGYHNSINITCHYWQNILGFKFNGHKQ